jgi:hypothetical protein
MRSVDPGGEQALDERAELLIDGRLSFNMHPA